MSFFSVLLMFGCVLFSVLLLLWFEVGIVVSLYVGLFLFVFVLFWGF